jgi:hypothetical protein
LPRLDRRLVGTPLKVWVAMGYFDAEGNVGPLVGIALVAEVVTVPEVTPMLHAARQRGHGIVAGSPDIRPDPYDDY